MIQHSLSQRTQYEIHTNFIQRCMSSSTHALKSIPSVREKPACQTMPIRKRATSSTPLLPPPPPQPLSELHGYLLMLLGALGWALQLFFVHLSFERHNFPTIASLLIRALIILLLSAAHIVIHRPTLPAAQLPILALRSAAGALGNLCIYTALKHITVGNATTLFCTSPVITTLLSALFLREPITVLDVLALVTSFTGVVLVAQPPFLFHGTVDAIPGAEPIFGVSCALLAACCGSTVYTLIRGMGQRVHYILNVVSLGLGLFALGSVLAGAEDVQHMLHNAPGVLVNVLASLGGFACVACFSRGLQLCRAGPAMVIRTTDIPVAFLLGYFFLGERLSFLTALGVVMVVGASLAISARAVFAKEQEDAEEAEPASTAR